MRTRAAAVLLAAATAVLSASACTGASGSPVEDAARAFLDAVGAGRTTTAAGLTDAPTPAQTAIDASRNGLGRTARATFRVDSPTVHGTSAVASFEADWTVVPGAPHWRYRGHVALVHRGGRWLVHWTPATEHPALRAGTHLTVERERAGRAPLLDSAGRALIGPTAVVTVGIEPKLVTDLPELAHRLAAVGALQSTAAEIESAVRKAASPTEFVPIITLRQPAYQAIRSRIHSLPGTVFQTGTEQLGPTPGFAQPLLGRVGPATAEIARSSGGRIAAGDQTGIGGLEQAYDARLAGAPGVQIGVADDRTGAVKVLASLARPAPGRPVRLTLDREVQQAADAALAGVRRPAAVVAVQPSTGRILADGNSGGATYDIGLQGALPPGSTFKIATWLAAFEHDEALTPDTPVPCPATRRVDGRTFVNENRFAHPPIPVRDSFGYSCNTTAIGEAMQLPASAIGDAARQLGVGATWHLAVPVYSGRVPAPSGQTEQAADAIGQGRVLTSPLAMALVAGAAATGHVRAPSLDSDRPAQSTQHDLPARLVDDMRSLMTATVRLPGGTAHSLASVPGLMGKTGTAEYGTARPPRTHTWFVGVRGDFAFAVFVYDGATNGGSALPIADRFLRLAGRAG